MSTLLQVVVHTVVALPAFAQHATADSARATKLERVKVTVTRDAARTPLELPFTTARVTPDTTRPGLRRSSIGELLLGIPGVVVQERSNPSQDPRLTVRGFGARAAFGVRGVRVLRDGIPLSLPDGQTPIDWLDLESIGSVDVVRGTASALYGNAAGGVVDFHSRAPDVAPFALGTRALTGAGITRANLTGSGYYAHDSSTRLFLRDAGWLASATSTHGDGARDWSRLDARNAFARLFAVAGGTRVEVQGTHYDAPRAENTGALTAAELAANPALPDPLNVQKRSRKAVVHSQVALLVSRTRGAYDWNASVFTSARTLDNPLPFAIVAVDRHAGGASLRGTRRIITSAWPLRLTAGADYQYQNDNRRNFENCADVPASGAVTTRCPRPAVERGALRLNQRELVRGTGVFARAEVELPGRVFASTAVRHDRVDFTVRDAFVNGTNADDSGNRTLQAVSPMFGVAWRVRPLLSLYANVSSAFETPTITELTNQDNGAAGVNRSLAPQRTATVEGGLQSIVASRLRVDVAVFRARVRDELVPFDVPNAPGRRAFRNAGRTARYGIEASVQGHVAATDVGLAYAYSHFRFDEYRIGPANYAGNPIPGIPDQQLQAYSTVRFQGLYGTAEVSAVSHISADDAAAVFAAGYATWALRGGYTGYTARGVHGRWSAEPVAGVENLFDRRFASSVVINATRFRSFEPGSRRRAYLGLKLGAR